MPALPLDEAGQYVAAAYTVFVVLLIVYVGIMAAKLGRISREIGELTELAERRERERRAAAEDPGSGATARSGPGAAAESAQPSEGARA